MAYRITETASILILAIIGLALALVGLLSRKARIDLAARVAAFDRAFLDKAG